MDSILSSMITALIVVLMILINRWYLVLAIAILIIGSK